MRLLEYGHPKTKPKKKFLLFYSDASLAEEGDVFGLNGQIEHKLAFLRKHVPRETSLVLVGHSIGCYIILEMMKRDPELKVGHDTPTLFYFRETPHIFRGMTENIKSSKQLTGWHIKKMLVRSVGARCC